MLRGEPGSFPRLVPPPLTPEDIKGDLYLCTHNHSDHADLDCIVKIKNKEEMLFVTARNSAKAVCKVNVEGKQIKEICGAESIELKGTTIRATFCILNDEEVMEAQ